jgi:hypothetical protein
MLLPQTTKAKLMLFHLLYAITHTQGQKFKTTGKIMLKSIHHDTCQDRLLVLTITSSWGFGFAILARYLHVAFIIDLSPIL